MRGRLRRLLVRSECARGRIAATARYAPFNVSSTHTAHGTFNVPSTLCSPSTSLPHRTLCSKPALISITYNAFLAYTPSTKTLSAASSPSRTMTTMHAACRGHISIIDSCYILTGPSPHPSASRPLCGPGNARWSLSLAHAHHVNLRKYSAIHLEVHKPVAAGRRSGTLLAVPIRQCALRAQRLPFLPFLPRPFPPPPPPLLVLLCCQDAFRLAPRPPVRNPGRAPRQRKRYVKDLQG
jgi:hypothetical protein